MNEVFANTPYSFSMINLVRIMPEWDWIHFASLMDQSGTRYVELVPGMVLGSDWDQRIETSLSFKAVVDKLKASYAITSIQSLTYGLKINLFESLRKNDDVARRFRSLAVLGNLLNCHVFVLGSPAQKKLKTTNIELSEHKKNFIANCAWMASLLGNRNILSLEHNTSDQGAEFCNTLRDMVDVIRSLKIAGIANVGLNLDTKCLIHEFGPNVSLCSLIDEYDLRTHLASIQVSLDFLERPGRMARLDEALLLQLARERPCPISLEEFGLLDNQLSKFIGFWQNAYSAHSTF